MVMGYGKVNPEFRCENNIIPNSGDALQMLGVTVDDMLKFDKHVAETLEKVNERAVRFVFRDKQITYEELLKHFNKNPDGAEIE